jgi:membrane protein DedA with SNARE-associated domain
MTPEAPGPLPPEIRPAVPPRVRSAILFGLVVTTAAGTLGTAFLPLLLVQHPVVLLLSSSDGRNIVLVAPQLDLPTLALIAVPRRILAMAVTYGVGALYGRTMLTWSARKLPRLSRLLVKFERLFARFQRTLLVLCPTYTTSVLAGVARIELYRFLPWMIVGQMVYVTVAYYLGGASARWTDWLIATISPYLWESTAVCVVLVTLQRLVSFARRRRAAQRGRLA